MNNDYTTTNNNKTKATEHSLMYNLKKLCTVLKTFQMFYLNNETFVKFLIKQPKKIIVKMLSKSASLAIYQYLPYLFKA